MKTSNDFEVGILENCICGRVPSLYDAEMDNEAGVVTISWQLECDYCGISGPITPDKKGQPRGSEATKSWNEMMQCVKFGLKHYTNLAAKE